MPNKQKRPAKAPKPPSAGYPEIEELIETEDFSEVNEKFQEAYNELEQISKKKKGLKKSKDSKQAMKAIELVMELFRELLTIKYRLEELAKKPKSK